MVYGLTRGEERKRGMGSKVVIRNMKSGADRKTVERNRRIQMKGLCCQLTSLVPPHHFNPFKETLSQQDQLDQTAEYIKKLKERIDELKVKRDVLALLSIDEDMTNTCNSSSSPISAASLFRVPVVECKELSSRYIEVIVVSGLERNFRLCDVISILQHEGADVVSTNISTVGDTIFHTLHAQVRVCRVGVDTSNIWQRLQDLCKVPAEYSLDS